MSEEPPLVLVVEDEPDLAALYAAWLGDAYRVRTCHGGREAIDAIDEAVDVIFLDRRMSGLSGDEVLAAVRKRDVDCRIAMVTAVDPDFDIVSMDFDDYLVKPVAKDELQTTVDRLLQRSEYDAGVQELFSLVSKKALLEAEKREATLDSNEEYRRLLERIEELQRQLDATVAGFDGHEDFENLFRDLGRDAADDR